MPSVTKTPRISARDRLLASADELFYLEGVHSVGIDRVIEHAGVAKASLYNTFGSKDELVHAYLKSRHERTTTRVQAAVDAAATPRAKLLAVFDSQSRIMSRPGFRGCAFTAASAEAKDGSLVEQATQEYRDWFRELFTRLSREAGARDPELLARQLHLLYDGAASSAKLDHDTTAATVARAAAESLLDAATPVRARPRTRRTRTAGRD